MNLVDFVRTFNNPLCRHLVGTLKYSVIISRLYSSLNERRLPNERTLTALFMNYNHLFIIIIVTEVVYHAVDVKDH